MLTFPHWLAAEPRWLALIPLVLALVLAVIEPYTSGASRKDDDR